MKSFTFIVLFASLFMAEIFSQSCLPDGISFYNQESIDNFQTNNPDCTEIEGNVTIGYDGYLTDISDLSGLNVITHIGGDLHIITNINLTDFSGLEALESIGGSLIIEDNDGITDFTGFDGLESVDGDLYVVENDNLSSFSGMGALTNVSGVFEMGHNLTFSSFNGLSSLTTTGGFEIYYIHNMPSMEGLSELTQINGSVRIVSCHGLLNLTGLTSLEEVTGFVSIDDNPELVSVEGLEQLTTVGGDMTIGFAAADKFVSLAGLSSLSSVGGNFTIAGTNVLQNLNGLEALTSIGGNLKISSNNQLASLEGIANIEAQSIGSLEIRYNPSLSACDVKSICEYLQIPGGNVSIDNNIAGCNSEYEVTAACTSGLIDYNNHMQFSLNPNPANKEVNIMLPEGIQLKSIFIYNLLGKKVFTAKTLNKVVDVSALEDGIYFLSISTDHGQAAQKLIIE